MTTWLHKTQAWVERYWQWVVAGLGAGAALVATLVVRRKSHKDPEPVVPEVAVDPSSALGPLADIGPQVEAIEAVVRDEAAHDAVETKEAHDAINAADSISAVTDILYGRTKSSDVPASTSDGGAAPTDGVRGKNKRR